MRYLLHNFLLDRMTKQTRKVSKQLGINISKGNKGVYDLLPILASLIPEIAHSMDFQIAGEETYWLENGRVAYYPETEALVDMWANSSIKLSDPAALFENEVFTLALPRDSEIKELNKLGSGLLVSTFNTEDKHKELMQPFNRRTGFGNVEIRQSQGMKKGKSTIALTYNLKSDNPATLSRTVLTDSFVAEYLEKPTFEHFLEVFKGYDDLDHLGMIKISDVEERRIQWKVLSVALGFLLFKKAMGDRIVDGLPSSAKLKDVETVIFDKRKHKLVKAPSSNSEEEKSYHLRSGHFRQLIDSRYYQGEFKNTPIGSRIVMVSPSVVGRKQENKTAK